MYTEKVRIYPNKQQRKQILDWRIKCCNLYNFILDCQDDLYDLVKLNINSYDNQIFINFVNTEGVFKQVLNDACSRSYKSRKRWLSSFKKGSKLKGMKHPKYKSLHNYRSFTYPQFNVKNGCRGSKFIDNKHIKLGKLGIIRCKLDRQINGKCKTCTIKEHKSGKYYAYITVDNADIQYPIPANRSTKVGIDLGIEKFAVMSDGTYISKPKFITTNDKKLCRLHRKLSKKQLGSNNKNKVRLKLAKTYEKLNNQRNDFHYKVIHFLTHKYESIAVENLHLTDLYTKDISKKLKNLLKLASLNSFLDKLRTQSVKYNCQIINVDPKNTTQLCSSCGSIVPKTLRDRVHSCPNCGFVCNRDLNAALNIEQLGFSTRGTVGHTGSVKLVETKIPGV